MNPTCHGDANGMIMSFITSGVAPFTYLWDRAGETTSDLMGVSAGIYNLTVTDSAGCSATVTIMVRDPDLLQIQLDSLKPVSCYGINDAAVYITPVGGNGGYTYSWDHGFLTQDITGLSADSTYCLTLHDSLGCRADTCYHISPVTQSIINFFPTICAGEVYVVGVNSYSITGVYNDTSLNIYGCDSINIFHLNVLPVAAHSIITSICDGQALNVGSSIYTSSGHYIDTLTSYNGCDSVVTTDLTVLLNSTHLINDSLCFGQSIHVGSNVYNTSGVFHDTLTNANGCDSVVTTTLFIYPNHLTLILDSLCAGESFMGSIIYNDTVLNRSLPDVHGCDSGIVYNIHVYASQKPFLGPDRNIIVGDSVFIISDVGISFVWSTGATTSQITAAPTVTTSYWVSSTDSNGCVATDTIIVNVRPIGDTLALPSAFSPNSDGVNDYYYPLLMPGMIIEDFTIFNRWGATVYTGTASPGWDGNFMGSPQPIGNYVFYCRVSVPDPLSPGSFITRYYNGVVTLLR
jgi:gliding motility-associated-like protein